MSWNAPRLSLGISGQMPTHDLPGSIASCLRRCGSACIWMNSNTSGTKMVMALLTSGRYVWKMKTIDAGQSWRSLKLRMAGAWTTGPAPDPPSPSRLGGPTDDGDWASLWAPAEAAPAAPPCERVWRESRNVSSTTLPIFLNRSATISRNSSTLASIWATVGSGVPSATGCDDEGGGGRE